jgi:hypothetical protein
MYKITLYKMITKIKPIEYKTYRRGPRIDYNLLTCDAMA